MSGFIWLASYPKSGNTWLRLALWSLQQKGQSPDLRESTHFAPIASSRRRFDAALGITSSDMLDDEILNLRPHAYAALAQWQELPLPSKVHDARILTPSGRPLFPQELTHSSVYLMRDPRDVAVSLAHHLGISIDATIAFMSKRTACLNYGGDRLGDQLKQPLDSWSEHVKSWMHAPDVSPLLLRYEDMLVDPVAHLSRVVTHIGWDSTPELLHKAVLATRFSSLQAAEAEHGFCERPRTAARFFRRGEAGAWREQLTESQARRIEADHGAIMREYGYL